MVRAVNVDPVVTNGISSAHHYFTVRLIPPALRNVLRDGIQVHNMRRIVVAISVVMYWRCQTHREDKFHSG